MIAEDTAARVAAHRRDVAAQLQEMTPGGTCSIDRNDALNAPQVLLGHPYLTSTPTTWLTALDDQA